MKTISRLLLAALLLLCAFPCLVLAQTAASVTPAAQGPSDASQALGWLVANWSAISTVILAVVAWWKHTQATGYKKAAGAMIVTLEAAGNTPQGAAVISQLKSTIATTAQAHGVGPLLGDLVTALTPAVSEEVAVLTCGTESGSAPAPGGAGPIAGRISGWLLAVLAAGVLGLVGCVGPGWKATAISLAQPAGFTVGQDVMNKWPKQGPAIIADVQVLLTDTLTKNAPILPGALVVWEEAEAAKLGIPVADVADLDAAVQTGIVALQAQYQADVKAGLGVTATAILTNFNAGLAQALSTGSGPAAAPVSTASASAPATNP